MDLLGRSIIISVSSSLTFGDSLQHKFWCNPDERFYSKWFRNNFLSFSVMILKTEADKKAEVSGQKYTHFFLQTTSIMAHTVRGLLPCRLESFVVTMVGSLAEKKSPSRRFCENIGRHNSYKWRWHVFDFVYLYFITGDHRKLGRPPVFKPILTCRPRISVVTIR